jgi:hypothetical protein
MLEQIPRPKTKLDKNMDQKVKFVDTSGEGNKYSTNKSPHLPFFVSLRFIFWKPLHSHVLATTCWTEHEGARVCSIRRPRGTLPTRTCPPAQVGLHLCPAASTQHWLKIPDIFHNRSTTRSTAYLKFQGGKIMGHGAIPT